MKKFSILLLLYLYSCGPSNHLKKYYTPEDQTVFDLVERLKKNAADKEAATLLPEAYTVAANKRKGITQTDYKTLSPGDRYVQMIKEWSIMQQMFDQVNAVPAAKAVIPNLWDPGPAIAGAKQKAAKEYYNQGLEYLNYNNRQAAANAYDYFAKANKIVPGYENVSSLMLEALERSTIKVWVKPAGYYRNNWNYWGYQNDWLQQQMVSDLNAQSYRDTRFYTDWDLNRQQVQPDRIVDLNFTEIYVGQVYSERYKIERSKQIQTGTTKSIPAQPVYKTVYATVFVTRKYMQSRASLECRIYDYATGRNLLFDRFPNTDDWRVETATYTGDRQALTPEDWDKINNRGNNNPPTRNEIADRLIRNCYSSLLNRIKTGVKFGSY